MKCYKCGIISDRADCRSESKDQDAVLVQVWRYRSDILMSGEDYLCLSCLLLILDAKKNMKEASHD